MKPIKPGQKKLSADALNKAIKGGDLADKTKLKGGKQTKTGGAQVFDIDKPRRRYDPNDDLFRTVIVTQSPSPNAGFVRVQRVQYASWPSQPCTDAGCTIQPYGDEFDVRPEYGQKDSSYSSYAVTSTITTSNTFFRARWEHNEWILSAPPSGGSSASYCLVHAPFNGGSTWGSSSANRFIRVVHFKPSGNTFVNAETSPLGYSIVTCWPRTTEAFWQPLQSTSGTGPFTASATAVYCGTLTIGGVEYISPIHPIVLFTPNPAIAAGDC